jgi:hypothetical protein
VVGLVATIRPGTLLDYDTGEMSILTAQERTEWRRRFELGEFLYKPYTDSPHWGVTISPESYLMRFWVRDCELLNVGHMLINWTQILVVFRRKQR